MDINGKIQEKRWETVAKSYEIVLFANLNDFTANTDNIRKTMDIFDSNWLPNIIGEFEFTVVPPQQIKRITMSKDDQWKISFLSNRIGIAFENRAQDELSKEQFIEEALPHIVRIFDSLSIKSSRISLLINDFIDCNQTVINEIGKSFSSELKFYESKVIPEWNVRFLSNESYERSNDVISINIITMMNSAKISFVNNSLLETKDGLVVVYDINTVPNNTENRFDVSDIEDFYRNHALPLSDKISADIKRLTSIE